MSGLLMSLVVIELVLTVLGAALYVYRRTLEFKEDTILILSEAEAHLASGQTAIHSKANQLSSILKWLSIAWVVFGIGLLVVWLGEGAGLL